VQLVPLGADQLLARVAIAEDGDEVGNPCVCAQRLEPRLAHRGDLARRLLVGELAAEALERLLDAAVEHRFVHLVSPFVLPGIVTPVGSVSIRTHAEPGAGNYATHC
jgi:hypothetical protein